MLETPEGGGVTNNPLTGEKRRCVVVLPLALLSY
jgi:hypothetical protein